MTWPPRASSTRSCSRCSTSRRSSGSTTTSGKETVQNLMALRFANALFEPVWNRNYIDHVQITAAEDIGIGGRAGYYERAGALRDLVQNHMLQLLALLTMEPPTAFDADRVRDEKLKVLEAIVPPERRRGRLDGGSRPSTAAASSAASSARLPEEHGRGARLAHRDLRGAAAARVQLALGGCPVLPADRQAAGAQADRDRRHPRAGPARRLSKLRLGRDPGQPDRVHGPARRGRIGVDRRQDPGYADADPPGQHGVPLRDLVPVASRRRPTSG